VLLRRLDPQARGLVSWPRAAPFAFFIILAGIGSLTLFLDGFAQARSLYGVAASLHAWIEIPILILALGGGAQRAKQRPTSSETELARSEISIA